MSEPTKTAATKTPAAAAPDKDQFFNEMHDRLMMAHMLVAYRQLCVDPDGAGVIILSDKDISKTRQAAGVLIYAEDGREWSLAGSGTDGADGLYCTILRVKPYPAK